MSKNGVRQKLGKLCVRVRRVCKVKNHCLRSSTEIKAISTFFSRTSNEIFLGIYSSFVCFI